MPNTEYSEKVTKRFLELVEHHAILPNDLVKIIEPISKSLRLRTRTNFANEIGKSYNGSKYQLSKCKTVNIDGQIFYITDEPD